MLFQCFETLQVRKNETSLRNWSRGTAHVWENTDHRALVVSCNGHSIRPLELNVEGRMTRPTIQRQQKHRWPLRCLYSHQESNTGGKEGEKVLRRLDASTAIVHGTDVASSERTRCCQLRSVTGSEAIRDILSPSAAYTVATYSSARNRASSTIAVIVTTATACCRLTFRATEQRLDWIVAKDKTCCLHRIHSLLKC